MDDITLSFLHGDIFVKSLLSMPASFCQALMFGVCPLAVVDRPSHVRRRRPVDRLRRGA
jgi:hypothetical protein